MAFSSAAVASVRGFFTKASIVIGASILFCILKYMVVVRLASNSEPSPAKPAMRVRMDAGQMAPIRISDKKGEFVITVNADDLDDLLNLPPKSAAPEVSDVILHNPFLCRNSPELKFIIYVHSSPANADKRRLLRQTYANTNLFKTFKFKVIFLLGLPKQIDVQQEIKREFDEHGDLIQGHFVDDYKNMTLKAVMGLNWIESHCPQAPFAIKVDDDTFFNIFDMLPVLQENADQPLLMICPLWKDGTMRILRERKSCMKWCVTKREISGDFYPQYCAGISYMLSRSMIQKLTAVAKTTPFFWVDDVYITGLLPRKIKEPIHYVDVMRHFTVDENLALNHYANLSQPLKLHLVHVRKRENFLPLWRLLVQRLTTDQRKLINEQYLTN